MSKSPTGPTTEETLARGALVNLLGMIGKLLIPVFFVVITRLFGPDTVGVFLLAFITIDVATNLTVSGINDGVLMLATRDDVAAGKDQIYQTLANGFAMSLGLAVLLVAASQTVAPWLLHQFYANAADLIPLVQIMAFALPFRVISIVVIAATKVKLTMKWDALLNGFGRSGLLLVASTIAFLVDESATALAWAYLAAWVAVGVAALFVFPVYYRYQALFREFRRFRISGSLVRFAVPQNLNMAFGRFATDIDAAMLAYFNVPPAQLAFYWMGGQVVRNLRQIKLIFSGAYAPIIVRLHMQGDRDAMNQSFSMVSRWATTLAVPGALIIVFFRSELIWFFHDTFTDDTTFMVLLLTAPLLSCIFGLAANIVVMTGHAKWNLINSLVMAGFNIALNFVLIPRYGIIGAAAATGIASLLVTTMTVVEARVLVGAKLLFDQVYKPLLAGLLAAAGATAWLTLGPDDGLPMRTLGAAASLAAYFVVLISLGVAEEDVRALLPWKRSKEPSA